MDDPTVTTYRPPVPLPLAWVVVTVFFLVGLGMAAGYQSVGGISSLVMGILACAFAVAMARNIVGNKLVVSHAGMTLWRRLRNQDIPWGADPATGVRADDPRPPNSTADAVAS